MNLKKLLILTASSLTLFTACDNKNKISSKPEEKIVLRVSWWGGEDRHQKTLEALKLFEKKYPNITVKAEYGGWQGWQEKITTQMAGGMAPDLMQINWNWINIFSKDGNGFYNLNNLSPTIDLSQYEQILLDQCIINGKLNAIPYGVAGRVFLYNKTTLLAFTYISSFLVLNTSPSRPIISPISYVENIAYSSSPILSNLT